MKKLLLLFAMGILLTSMCGCLVLLAGGAAGAGTAVWLSGKMTQQFNTPYEQTIRAAQNALTSLKLEVVKETKEENVTQLRSKYSDGKDVWVDIRKITENSTKVEVRVGVVNPDKAASEKIMKKIQIYL
jgi:predicted lipoprotein